jgi:hypothetical protein
MAPNYFETIVLNKKGLVSMFKELIFCKKNAQNNPLLRIS